MSTSYRSYISGSLALVLSTSLILLSLQTHEKTEYHQHSDRELAHQIIQDHIFCPICNAVVEGASQFELPDTHTIPSESAQLWRDHSPLLDQSFSDQFGRAPPVTG